MKQSRSVPDPEQLAAATATDGAEAPAPRIDLSALDPSRDPLRWERTIASLAARAASARAERLTVTRQLHRWARPALALATVAAAASWVLALARPLGVAPRVEQAPEVPAYAIARWATTGELPSTSNILDVLGGNNGAR